MIHFLIMMWKISGLISSSILPRPVDDLRRTSQQSVPSWSWCAFDVNACKCTINDVFGGLFLSFRVHTFLRTLLYNYRRVVNNVCIYLESVFGPFAMTLLFRCIQFFLGTLIQKKVFQRNLLITGYSTIRSTGLYVKYYLFCQIFLESMLDMFTPLPPPQPQVALESHSAIAFFHARTSAVQDLSFAFFAFVPTGSQSFPFGATCHSPILTIQYKPDFDPISLQCSLSNGSCMDSSA